MSTVAASFLARDVELLRLLRTRGHAPGADRLVALASRSGEHAACWLLLGAAGATRAGRAGRRQEQGAWLRGMGIVGAAYGVNTLVKLLVRRPRPTLPGLPPLSPVVSSLSFPSAHATTSFAAVGGYRGLAPRRGLLGAAVAFAVSRPYLGVHYPSDVAAGALLGTAFAAVWPGGALPPAVAR